MITFERVCKSFNVKGGEVHALTDVSLTIKRGEIFGIIGASGAGKSTLVRLCNLLERPTSGRVLFDGVDLTALKPRALNKIRQNIGMIFQSFNLLSQRNVLDNVTFPLEIGRVGKAEARKRAIDLLDMVGLADKMSVYPNQLSGGQKQRVAIARALATNPTLLLCDEATSALDPTTTASILQLLEQINRTMGVTVLIITHEMSVVEQICHSLAIMDNGRVVETGEVTAIFRNPKSEAARNLMLKPAVFLEGGDTLRIVFDGQTAFEPIISSMTLECRAVVNILFADTMTIEGKSFGQMVLQLPNDAGSASRIRGYLDDKGIFYKEERAHVFC